MCIWPAFSTEIPNSCEPTFDAMRVGKATPMGVLKEAQRLAEAALRDMLKSRPGKKGRGGLCAAPSLTCARHGAFTW
ncbi:MAG: hypothetical protein ACOYEP_05185, partial [Limnochordia bacterium]